MEKLILPEKADKETLYEALLPQLRSFTARESSVIANMANLSAALHEAFGFFWTGFYLRVNDKVLVLGPFQGPPACTRLTYGRGVCGTAWKEERTVIVPDVEKFPGHVACSSLSKSEIVVPIFRKGKVFAVLDIDSAAPATFDEIDARYLEEAVKLLV